MIRPVFLLGVAALLTACGESSPDKVTASNGSVAAGGDLSVGRDLVLNEFDQDEKRSRELARFVSSTRRNCLDYLVIAEAMEVTDKPTGEIPNLLGYHYTMMPELPGLVGVDAYNSLTTQQAELHKISGEIFSMQFANLMADAQPYMKSSKQPTIPGVDLSADPRNFPVKKQELLTKAREHCDYVRSLK